MPIDNLTDYQQKAIEEEQKTLLPRPKRNYLNLVRIQSKTWLMLAGGIFLLLLAIILLSLLFTKHPISQRVIAPTPIPTPVEEKIASPSAYATDSAILKLEQQIKDLDLKLQQADIKEKNLLPPVLDLDVKFPQR